MLTGNIIKGEMIIYPRSIILMLEQYFDIDELTLIYYLFGFVMIDF